MAVLQIPADQALSFLEIEIRCRKDQPNPSESGEIIGGLTSSWLKGELVGRNGPSRLSVLRHLFSHHHDHIAFEIPGGDAPLRHVETEDGGLRVIRPSLVHVPNLEPSTWTNENCATAYDDLAENWIFLERELVDLIGLTEVTRDVFFRWLEKQGPWRPTFWGDPSTSAHRVISASRAKSRTPQQVIDAIRKRLADGNNPPETERWKEFMAGIKSDLGSAGRKPVKGLSESNVQRKVREIQSRQ